MRNWRSIALLISFPLLIIFLVFLSFNPDGLQVVPIGVVSDSDLSDFKDKSSSYFSIEEFDDIEECISGIKSFEQYMCLNVSVGRFYSVEIHFDNTRDAIIWSLIARLEEVIEWIQRERSRDFASGFVDQFLDARSQLDGYLTDISLAQDSLDSYERDIDAVIDTLENSRSDLSSSIAIANSQLDSIETELGLAESRNSDLVSSLSGTLSSLESTLSSLNVSSSAVSSLENSLENHQDRVASYVSDAESTLLSVRREVDSASSYSGQISNYVSQLRSVQGELSTYRNRLSSLHDDISTLRSGLSSLSRSDTEVFVNPVSLSYNPAYIPSVDVDDLDTEGSTVDRLIKGLNLISLQTFFPLILILITVFLSLLISSFICLTEINSPAKPRVRLVRGIFLSDFISVYLSSIIIMILPILCVVLVGKFIFLLPLFTHGMLLFVLLFLLSSSFIFFGMGLAYLIKKESITLLVTTFILLFFLFFSGFILPLERMSPLPSAIASVFPSQTALSFFNKIIFYSQVNVNPELPLLLVTLGVSLVVCLLVKIIRRQ